ncbi:MAG: hypothetical protein AABX88_00920 [Nanoarchaeota archaeon]
MSKTLIQKTGEEDKVIDTTSIEEMRSKLEKKLIDDVNNFVDDAGIINETYELYEQLNSDQIPYYINMILGVLHRASGMYKWASKNPERVIEIRDFLKIFENYKKENPEFAKTQEMLKKFNEQRKGYDIKSSPS